jgi:hypothetical protein
MNGMVNRVRDRDVRCSLIAIGVLCATLSAVGALAQPAQPAQGTPRLQTPSPGPRTPPRDTSARPTSPAPLPGTATISGRVVAADSGQSLGRATVTAVPVRTGEPLRRGAVFDRSPRLSARTDDDGRYAIAQVPAGEYTLSVRRAGFVEASFGQITSRTPPRRVSVADGARVGPLDFQLLRGGVITGRVVDDAGEPAERVAVRAMQQVRRGGQARVGGAIQVDQTDDQGHYRLFGLPPGEYLIVAEPGDRRGPARARDGAIQGVDVDIIPTYGPGTVNPAEALRVQVQAGLEAAMDVQLVAARIATVRGRVLTSIGEPLGGGSVRIEMQGGDYGGMNRGGPITSGGQFEIDGVAPGTYTLVAQGMMRGAPDGPAGPTAPEAAVQTITVEGEDLVVPVVTSPGSTARGRIRIEGDGVGLGDRTLRITTVPVNRQSGFSFPGRGRVAPDLTFEITGLRGEQAVSVQGLPEGWWLKDVRVAGQDALDGFDFGQGKAVSGVEILISTRRTGLSGAVTMPTGATAADYAVVLFSEDEARWEQDGPGQSAGARIVRPGLDGTFTMPGLRPGSYYVLAVPAAQAEYPLLADPGQLRELAGRARTVEVKDGEMSTLTLTLVNR